MVKKTKGKHRLDKYYYLAKEQGFRSRAAFKLVQLNRKYHFLEKSRTLLDLCAAPGGWLQVAVKHMPMSSLIVGVDLVPIRPIRGAKTIIGDITSAQCRQALEKLAGGSLMDAVIHDGAPNIGGAWASESASQTALALQALRLATFFMAPKATFVSKVFRSQDYNAFLYALNQLFDKVVATKPAASRNASAEIFVVCLGYKAPAKIDARLLDPKHLFQEVTEAAPVSQGPDALLRTKMMKKRHREGYEEGVSVMHKPTSVAAFLAAKDPVSMLGQFSRFELEGAASEPGAEVEDGAALAEIARTHEGTNDEIRQLCQDLQVLGRSEFKQLIKWRIQMKRDFSAAKAKATGDVEAVEETEEERTKVVEEGEDGLLAEMAEVRKRMEQRTKREKKKTKEQKKRSRIRAAQLAMGEGIADGEQDHLFSLAGIKGLGSKAAGVDRAAPSDQEMAALDESSDDGEEEEEESSDEGDDPDEDRRKYDAMMDAYMEDSYQSYLKRHGEREKAAAEKRKRLGMATELSDSEAEGDADGAQVVNRSQDPATVEAAEEGQGLLVSLDPGRAGRAASKEAVAAQWFSQDLFQDADLADTDEPTVPSSKRAKTSGAPAGKSEQAGQTMAAPKRSQQLTASGVQPMLADCSLQAPQPSGLDNTASSTKTAAAAATMPEAQQPHPAKLAGQSGPAAGVEASDSSKAKKGWSDAGVHAEGDSSEGEDGDAGGFEVVPRDASEDSEASSDDEDARLNDLDADGKAEVLALARKMLNGKARNEILDGAYNRHAFHDVGVPRWFYEDEQRHMKPPAVISQDEKDAEKAPLRAVDARPIKKVAEAKARKRKRMQVKLEAARSKAEGIAAQEDRPLGSRMRDIEKVYAKARSTGKGKGKDKAKKPGKTSRSETINKAKKGRPLDRRMFADKRQINLKAKKKAGKGRKGAGGAASKGGKGAAGKGGAGKGKGRPAKAGR